MNGRVQDSLIGRFMSADPRIQDPTNPQSYNRYSYAVNGPVTYSDPTGFDYMDLSDGGGGVSELGSGGNSLTAMILLGFSAMATAAALSFPIPPSSLMGATMPTPQVQELAIMALIRQTAAVRPMAIVVQAQLPLPLPQAHPVPLPLAPVSHPNREFRL